ncbi:hypothetical protein PF005_g18780 [Phytophthora fragariae]|uniref:RxLR effector protein n=2 Tax=Phytophthora TaxID=4783 RepID=A0A6A3FN88_9STRA|nr:hypothetical protein PF003_g6107 [Phytophthora fragariae]KAE8977667.1 hypothetical protein PR001_g25067 [Phytophthora rubi]KAE8947504.1 hypothetical protein PF009_g2851 [Phytophthora fragariae]KAE8992961.1 hypothetical protein PR002_g20386 [Phytophthora rubi]KAE9022379.1 hypothetical protein PF011_g4483 [Phytophthora fragariae]
MFSTVRCILSALPLDAWFSASLTGVSRPQRCRTDQRSHTPFRLRCAIHGPGN